MALHPARDIVGKLAEKVLQEVVLREVRKAPAWGRRGLVCQDIQDVGSKFEQVTPHAYSFSDSKVCSHFNFGLLHLSARLAGCPFAFDSLYISFAANVELLPTT